MFIDKIGVMCIQNIWVDLDNGNDETGNGTYENPFKSLEKVPEEILNETFSILINNTFKKKKKRERRNR